MNKKYLIAGVAVLVLGGGLYWWKQKPTGPRFENAKVTRGNITITVEATGTVQPENRLEIKPPVAGRIDEVLVQEGALVRKGQILAWMSSTERAALLDAARANGAAEYARWSELYKATPIMSPLAGTLILKNIEPGQTVTNADAILVLSNRLTVKAQVDETDIAQITLGKDVSITLDAYAKEKIPGKVSLIAFEATTTNNITTYIVDATPAEQPSFMRSGMTATVNFIIEKKDNVLLVANSALEEDGGQVSVRTRTPEGKPRKTSVKTGLTDGKNTEIIEGLTEGQEVLIPLMAAEEDGKAGNPFMPSRKRR